MTTSKRDVYLYDPNLNSYGFEVAACLSQAGHPVSWWGMPTPARPHVDGLRQFSRLAPMRGNAKLGSLILRRLVGPLAFCLQTGSSVAIICWVRDAWDAALFLLRASLGLPTVVVYHDPRELRPRGGLAGFLEQMLLHRATVVVHSPWHQTVVRDSHPHAIVAPHPPYAQTVAAAGGVPARQPQRGVYCLVGGLRPDKGLENLLPLAQATRLPWRLRVIGPDALNMQTTSALNEAGVTVEYADCVPPSDADLIRLMATSAAMIAPYTAPTTSGSAIMAVTLGVPVLALRSVAFDGLLPQECMASDIPELASLLDSFQDFPVGSYPSPREQEASVGEAWSRVVENA